MDTYTDIEKQEKEANSIRYAMPSHANSNSQASDSARNCCIFSWRNISYSIETPTGKKQILKNIEGCAEKGYSSSLTLPIPFSFSPSFPLSL